MIIFRLLVLILINFQVIYNQNIPLDILTEIFVKAASQISQFSLFGGTKSVSKRDLPNLKASVNGSNPIDGILIFFSNKFQLIF